MGRELKTRVRNEDVRLRELDDRDLDKINGGSTSSYSSYSNSSPFQKGDLVYYPTNDGKKRGQIRCVYESTYADGRKSYMYGVVEYPYGSTERYFIASELTR